MVFLEFLDFLEFMETSEVVGPGPNPREIDISFGADGPLACARPDPTIGWTDVLPCVFVCVWGEVSWRLASPPGETTLGCPLYSGLQSMAGGPRATLRNTKRGEGTGEHASRPAHALHARLLLCTAWPVPRHPMLTFVLCVAQCCLHERSDSYEMCAVAARMCSA